MSPKFFEIYIPKASAIPFANLNKPRTATSVPPVRLKILVRGTFDAWKTFGFLTISKLCPYFVVKLFVGALESLNVLFVTSSTASESQSQKRKKWKWAKQNSTRACLSGGGVSQKNFRWWEV